MKIFIGVDGSEGALQAVRMAGRLADADDKIRLCYSAPELPATTAAPPDSDTMARGQQALADVVFDTARDALPAHLRAAVETMLGTADTRADLTKAAEEWGADLVVVGARGTGKFQQQALGNVALSLARTGKAPVLVARPLQSRDGKLRVLVACEGNETDEQLAGVLNQISWPGGTVARTVTVVESLFAGEVPRWLEHKARSPEVEAIAQAFEREFEADKEAIRERNRSFCARLPSAFTTSEPLVLEGHAAEQILSAIASERADLIVLGARGQNVLARWLLGSTSEKVLSHAPCSVLIVHRKD
jgi:nucleotide-binding universal stress UspA family protein